MSPTGSRIEARSAGRFDEGAGAAARKASARESVLVTYEEWVGTRAWILLFVGRQNQAPLFLQAKEAQASVLERYVGRSAYANHGRRVVEGQRLMQAASDLFLGWLRFEGLDGQMRDYDVHKTHD